MKVCRTLGVLRLVLLIGGSIIALLALPQRAMAQAESNNLVDDQCYDIGYGTGCDVEGIAIIAADSSEVDSYVETDIDITVADDGWLAFVEGDLSNGNYCFTDGDLQAYCSMVDSTVLNNIYTLIGYHGVDDGSYNPIIAGNTKVWISAVPPTVVSLQPTFGYVGIPGEILVTGSYFLDPNILGFGVSLSPASNGNISGMSVSPDAVSSDGTQALVGYTLTTCAGTGTRFINIITSFGSDHGDVTFNVGDPTPTILSVTPGVWQAGTASLPITINGIGFGDNPTLIVAGNGVALVSTGSVSDTQITATVSISSNAPAQTALVTVQSNGYCGSGFQPANNNSSIGTSGVPVQPIPAPTPTIQLYGQNITTTQSVVVGQQIALSAVVNGATVQSQQWSLPGGTVVGGYNASVNGGGCVVLIQGQASQNGSCSGNTVSTTNSSFAFYWVDSGSGTQQTVTYTYTATNGESASATATFDIDAPSGVTVIPGNYGAQLENAVTILPPPSNKSMVNPVLIDGPPGAAGLNLEASASYLPTGGSYQWVQLKTHDVENIETPQGSKNCNIVSNTGTPILSSTPVLDNTYPYSIVYTVHVTNDGVDDSPNRRMAPQNGEVAISWAATMYLTWIPPVLTTPIQCPNGSSCTIPVPLGNFNWSWDGDVVNTLNLSSNNGVSYPNWTLNDAYIAPDVGLSDDNSFPTWTLATQNSTVYCPWI